MIGKLRVQIEALPRWAVFAEEGEPARYGRLVDLDDVLAILVDGIDSALDDYLGHAIDEWLAPSSVDSRHHNVNGDGSPAGDCYKCHRVRDFLRAALLGEENPESALATVRLRIARSALSESEEPEA